MNAAEIGRRIVTWTAGIRGRFIADTYAGHLRPGSRVLDIGCGDGTVSGILSRRFGLDLVGTDIADYRIEKIPFVPLPESGRLPFADGSFDFALINDALHHATDQRRVIDEALRVAGTVLAFEVPPGPIIAAFDRSANFFHYRDMPIPLAFRTIEGWRDFLRASGRQVAVRDAGKPGWWYPFRHILIVISDAETRPPLQSADRELHPR